ncbi:MAG: phage tail protein [Rouxiella badensis]|jgi:hypothetical protein|uniref:Putative tail fiber protein gp53-like C-terminal domain-containing protein n=1 Tax=Rouxiella badensis TaxID=1646377 RepID=A0A1X0WAG2_9GAMM|nr:hypothetical protein [Rouxiella badensis]ORJ23772.1 hypothetical protein BS640_19740 [Rouxiella badensis]QOI54811.1 phage tail protein [Rouxiella badensis subsp. acadiensis]WAT04098.1 phage tail protein [Rouxiella badensis]
MDRQIVYPGAVPLDTDLLHTNKYAMIGLAKLSAALMGASTYLRGLECTPTTPTSMTVNVAKGEIYSLQNVDGTAYSSLEADTSNTILKQGLLLSSTSFTLAAPSGNGQSINYLLQVAYSDSDSGATVLPYYNAANPAVAYSGPGGNGAAQNTVRAGLCSVALKTGVAATTGTQTTPAADTGYTAAWVITVAQGTTTLTAANISATATAPFLPASGLIAALQQCTMTYAIDKGAANVYTASFTPALPTLVDGMRLTFKAKTANTASSTFAANGGTAYPIYSQLHLALQGGEIVANGLIEIEWNSSLNAWILCGNSGGALPVVAGTKSNHAVNLGQFTSGTGSTKLPDGTIINWGRGTGVTTSAGVSISFQIPFSNSSSYSVSGQSASGPGSVSCIHASSFTANGCNISVTTSNGSSTVYWADPFTWIAIGR